MFYSTGTYSSQMLKLIYLLIHNLDHYLSIYKYLNALVDIILCMYIYGKIYILYLVSL